MSILTEHRTRPTISPIQSSESPAERLRATMAAVRLSFTWMGTRKALSPEQRDRAAEAFDARGRSLSAGKKLLDTGHAAFRAVTAVRGRADAAWKAASLPFPEPGVRLIRHDDVEPFVARMEWLRHELDDAVADLARRFGELKGEASTRLGRLYDPADYPESLEGLFGFSWDFPNVEPPDYLMRLAPDVYERERARVAGRFEEAVQLAEQAFLDEFARLVSHLCERLDDDGGGAKVFRDSAVGNLAEFFGRFRSLGVRSNAQLEELVDMAQTAVRGAGPRELRDSAGLRGHVASRLEEVRGSLEAMLVDRPRRRILRHAAGEGA